MGIIQSAVNQGLGSVAALEAITGKREKKKQEEAKQLERAKDLRELTRQKNIALGAIDEYRTYGNNQGVDSMIEMMKKQYNRFADKYGEVNIIDEALRFEKYARESKTLSQMLGEAIKQQEQNNTNRRNKLGGN